MTYKISHPKHSLVHTPKTVYWSFLDHCSWQPPFSEASFKSSPYESPFWTCKGFGNHPPSLRKISCSCHHQTQKQETNSLIPHFHLDLCTRSWCKLSWLNPSVTLKIVKCRGPSNLNGSRILCTSKAIFLYSQVLSIHKYKPKNKLVWR